MHERLQKGLSSKSRALPHRAWPSSQGCFNSPALALSIDYSVYFVGTSIALQRTPTRSRCAEPMQRLPGFDDIGRGVCGGHQRPWRTPEWHVGTDGIAAGRARAVKAHSGAGSHVCDRSRRVAAACMAWQWQCLAGASRRCITHACREPAPAQANPRIYDAVHLTSCQCTAVDISWGWFSVWCGHMQHAAHGEHRTALHNLGASRLLQ